MPITIESRPLSSRSTPVDNSIASSPHMQRLARVLEWYGIARTLYGTFRKHHRASKTPRSLFTAHRRSHIGRTNLARSAGLAIGVGLIVYTVLTLARHFRRQQHISPSTDLE